MPLDSTQFTKLANTKTRTKAPITPATTTCTGLTALKSLS